MVVIPIIVHLELFGKIFKGIESMSGIEALIVFPVAAFHLAIVPGHKRPDQLVADTMAFQMYLEQGGLVPVGGKTIGEFRSVVCLNALNAAGKGFNQMFHKHSRGIGAVFFKGFHIAPPGILINGGILKELLTNDPAVDKAGRGHKFHIHLNTLPRMIHLLIRLRNILRVRGMDCRQVLLFQETVQSGNGAGITTLHELDPEDNKTGIRIATAHIHNELDLLLGMLVRMVVRSAREVAKRLNRAVKAPFPAIDILSVGLIFDGGLSHSIFFSISD